MFEIKHIGCDFRDKTEVFFTRNKKGLNILQHFVNPDCLAEVVHIPKKDIPEFMRKLNELTGYEGEP